jgi:hypothetical protein
LWLARHAVFPGPQSVVCQQFENTSVQAPLDRSQRFAQEKVTSLE